MYDAKRLTGRLSFAYILIAVLFQATGGIFSKYASLSLSNQSFLLLATNIFYISSIACLALQALFWQQALKYYKLSFAYPFISLVNYVVLIFSYFLFSEAITLGNVLGLFLISVGIYLLTREGGYE